MKNNLFEKIKENKIFALGIIGYLILATCFFWHSKIDIDIPIDSNRFSDFGTFAASLIAFIALLYSSNEYLIKKYEKKPYLFVNRIQFKTEDKTIEINLTEDKENNLESAFYIDGKQVQPYIEISNIGYANAIHIQVEWNFNETWIKYNLKDLYNSAGYNERQKKNYLEMIKIDETVQLNLPEYWMRQNGIKLNNGFFEQWELIDKDASKKELYLILNYKNVDYQDFKQAFQLKSKTHYDKIVKVMTVEEDYLNIQKALKEKNP